MMEITAVGLGLMMTAVAVAVGGLVLEATLLMLGRAVRPPPLGASTEHILGAFARRTRG